MDVNGAYIVMIPSVEVLEELEEQPPTTGNGTPRKAAPASQERFPAGVPCGGAVATGRRAADSGAAGTPEHRGNAVGSAGIVAAGRSCCS